MSLNFKIELSGNFAGALEKGAAATDKASEATRKHRNEIELFEGEIGKAKGEFAGFAVNLEAFGKGGSLFTFDLAEGLRSAVELASKLVEGIVDLGKEIVGVAGKTQDLDLAINLNVGEKQAAAIDELAEGFERTTRFDANDIKRALLPLLKQGIGDTETLDTIATIGTDLSARSGGGIEEVQQTVAAFAGIFQRGRLKPAQLAQFGISADAYFKELGATMGVSAKQAEQLAKKGEITGSDLARVAARMVAAKQGGAIGTPSLKGGEGMGATLERLGNLRENLFERLAKSPAMTKVQATLDRFIETMNGEAGDKLIAQIGDVFEQIATYLSPEKITEWAKALSHVGDIFEEWRGTLDKIVTAIEVIGVIFVGGKIISGVTALAAALPALGAAAGGLVAELALIAAPLGAIVVAAAAVTYAITEIVGTVKELGGLKQVAQDLKDWIAGPGPAAAKGNTPKTMHWDEATQGYKPNVPAMAAGGIVTGPTLALVGEAGPEAIVPLDRAGGLGNQITVTYAPIYQVGGGGEMRGEIEAIERQSRIEFKKVIDELLAS